MITVVDGVAYWLTPKAASTSIQEFLKKKSGLDKLPRYKRESLPEVKYSVGFVRHPIDRLVSTFCNKIKGDHCQLHRSGFSPGLDWTSFVAKVCETPDHKADKHFRSQSWHLAEGEKILPDRIIRFEKIWEFFPDLPWCNASEHGHWWDYANQLEPQLARRLMERYRLDFELFGYKEYCHEWNEEVGYAGRERAKHNYDENAASSSASSYGSA